MSRIQICALSDCICDKYGFEYDSAQIPCGDFYAPHLPPVDSVHGAFAVTDAGHDPVSLSSGGTRPQCNVLSRRSDSVNEPNYAVSPRSKNRGANTLCMTRQHEGEPYDNSLSLLHGRELGPTCYDDPLNDQFVCRRVATPPSPRRSVGVLDRDFITRTCNILFMRPGVQDS